MFVHDGEEWDSSSFSAIAIAWIAAVWKDLSLMTLASTAAVFVYQAKFKDGRFFLSALMLAAFFASASFFVFERRSEHSSSAAKAHFAPVVLLLLVWLESPRT